MSVKICSRCNIEKDLTKFGKHKSYKNGIRSYCKECGHKENKLWKQNNSIKLKKQYKDDYKSNPVKYWTKRLKTAYGITTDQYNQMLSNQNHVCAVCNKPETAVHNNGKIRNLAVDHCHATGKVRGLLCDACNKAEGILRSNSSIMRKLADYVDSHKESEQDLNPAHNKTI